MLRKSFSRHYKFMLIFFIILSSILLINRQPKNLKYECKDCNLVLIVIDALRYDHLGCYGYERNTSPNIDKLSEKSIIFENAITQSSWTKPSIISLFISKYVSFHNVTRFTINYTLGGIDNILSPEALTFTEILSSNGYRTKALVGNDFIQKGFGLEQGFDDYVSHLGDYEITLNAIDWINELNEREKFFLYLHYMAPHAPYTPSLNYKIKFKPQYYGNINFSEKHQEYFNRINMSKEDVEELVARYDGEINYIDEEIGRVINCLKEKKIFNKTVIIITADHGELLGEKGMVGHGGMANKVIQVPLLIYLPPMKEGKRIERIVELIDLAPTILNILNIPVPKSFQGRDIVNDIDKRENIGFSEWVYRVNGVYHTLVGIRSKRYFFISKDYKNFYLYDIKQDPYQTKNILNEKPILLAYFTHILKAYNNKSREILPSKPLSKEIIKKLRNMGYIP